MRELREELGIEVCLECLAPFTFASHAYETFHLLMPLFLCAKWEGEITPREGQTHQVGARQRACATTRCRPPTCR